MCRRGAGLLCESVCQPIGLSVSESICCVFVTLLGGCRWQPSSPARLRRAQQTESLSETTSESSGEVEAQAEAAEAEEELLNDIRQLTFEGRRAGEGYFSSDGTEWCFKANEIRGTLSIKST